MSRVCLWVLLVLSSQDGRLRADTGRWVVTWGCGIQLTEPRNLPPVSLSSNTVRQFVRNSIGGKQVRILFSNAYGTEPVTIHAAHIALSSGKSSAGQGDIQPTTGKALAFKGEPDAFIQPGQVFYSDSLDFDLPPLTNVAVTVCFGNISATTITGHPGSRTTSFIIPGNVVAAKKFPEANKTPHWYIIAGMEVMVSGSGRAVSILGDSLTDGRGSTTDGNDRWPDALAERLATNAPTAEVAVINMGIGGNGLFGGLGPSAVSRFDRDIINQNGVRYFILFEGVNDMGYASEAYAPALASKLISTYTQFADKAHARNIRAFAATITPMGGSSYYTPARETIRQSVNAWIRTNNVFDGVIDFDAVVRDPSKPANILPAYVASPTDTLHINPAGYRAMAASVDLNLFKP